MAHVDAIGRIDNGKVEISIREPAHNIHAISADKSGF
jgi:hypothetical protein